MAARTPLTVITGPLGSGKTTLLRHILEVVANKIAILINEFGEIAIDSKIITGKNVQLAELDGGCVCCTLLGEFEAAVDEIIATVHPEMIIVETTGVAEPEALLFDIQDTLAQLRLDGVIAVADADALLRFPQLGHTSRLQIEAADLLLLNKADLLSPKELEKAKAQIIRINAIAPILCTRYCQVDPELLFGIGQIRSPSPPRHRHQPEFQSFSYVTDTLLDRACFERLAERLSEDIYRSKGFIRFSDAGYLFNFVAGRWQWEPFAAQKTELVFIGKGAERHKQRILAELHGCER